jgi:hypothetical protein
VPRKFDSVPECICSHHPKNIFSIVMKLQQFYFAYTSRQSMCVRTISRKKILFNVRQNMTHKRLNFTSNFCLFGQPKRQDNFSRKDFMRMQHVKMYTNFSFEFFNILKCVKAAFKKGSIHPRATYFYCRDA